MSNDNIIKLDVGGQLMSTYKSTLLKLNFFQSYLDRWNDHNQPLFLDVDPDLFKHILNKLRDPLYELPQQRFSGTNFERRT